MGCHEPLSVRKAEYEMWRLLFDIVSDPRDVVAKILNFLCTVQKPDISDDDAKWFSEGNVIEILELIVLKIVVNRQY